MLQSKTDVVQHGVVGIKHSVDEDNRTLTLVFLMSCAICPTAGQTMELSEGANSYFEVKYAESDKGRTGDLVMKWSAANEACGDNTEDDIRKWIVKASQEGRIIL